MIASNTAFISISGLILIFSFLPWAKIPSSGIILYGWDMEGTNFGKPAILTITFTLLTTLVFLIFGRSHWGKLASAFSAALLIAWHTKNWLLLSICDFGECLNIFLFFHILTVFILLQFVLIISKGRKW